MAECPVCFGGGEIDCRDADAAINELLTDAELAALGPAAHAGVLPCDECERTGVVTEERAREIMDAARATVDRVMARLEDEGRL